MLVLLGEMKDGPILEIYYFSTILDQLLSKRNILIDFPASILKHYLLAMYWSYLPEGIMKKGCNDGVAVTC